MRAIVTFEGGPKDGETEFVNLSGEHQPSLSVISHEPLRPICPEEDLSMSIFVPPKRTEYRLRRRRDLLIVGLGREVPTYSATAANTQ